MVPLDVNVALMAPMNGPVLSPQNAVDEVPVISGWVGGFNPFVRTGYFTESGHGNPIEGWLYFHPKQIVRLLLCSGHRSGHQSEPPSGLIKPSGSLPRR